jgi:hypothetical protein
MDAIVRLLWAHDVHLEVAPRPKICDAFIEFTSTGPSRSNWTSSSGGAVSDRPACTGGN